MPKRPRRKMPPSLGPGITTLSRLAAEYARHSATLYAAIDLLTLHQTGRKRTSIPAALDQAIAMDRERRETAGALNGTRAPNGTYTAARLRKRQGTADLLAHFDPVAPRPAPATGGTARVGPLIRHGFLKKKGKGYIRTPKPFHP